MTSDEFRRAALSLPGAEEQSHMWHPDFRVGSKVFATLGYPDAHHGMVKLTVEQQHAFTLPGGTAFAPARGAWGLRGSTLVLLSQAEVADVEEALRAAWSNVAQASQRKQKPRKTTRR